MGKGSIGPGAHVDEIRPRSRAIGVQVSKIDDSNLASSRDGDALLYSASRSLPASRRNSDESQVDAGTKSSPAVPISLQTHERFANRPQTLVKRTSDGFIHDEIDLEDNPVISPEQMRASSFLFEDDYERSKYQEVFDVKSYIQMNATDDKFPILVRRDSFPGIVCLF